MGKSLKEIVVGSGAALVLLAFLLGFDLSVFILPVELVHYKGVLVFQG